jgi:hypothetical protein
MTRPILSRRAALLTGAALTALLGACASTPPPTDQIAVSTAALAHAAGAGSAELAPMETSMARDKLVRARAALANNDNDLALALAQQAQVDAQLAESKTESIKARKTAEAMQEANRALREELARKTP